MITAEEFTDLADRLATFGAADAWLVAVLRAAADHPGEHTAQQLGAAVRERLERAEAERDAVRAESGWPFA